MKNTARQKYNNWKEKKELQKKCLNGTVTFNVSGKDLLEKGWELSPYIEDKADELNISLEDAKNEIETDEWEVYFHEGEARFGPSHAAWDFMNHDKEALNDMLDLWAKNKARI